MNRLTPEQHTAANDRNARPGCQSCARLLSNQSCAAMAVLTSAWAKFAVGPYRNDPGQRKQKRQAARMQADTTAAEDYRRGAVGHCEAHRKATTSPAKGLSQEEAA